MTRGEPDAVKVARPVRKGGPGKRARRKSSTAPGADPYWENQGRTDLEDLALVCDFHHDQVHHGGWQIAMAADGHPEFVPPEHVDPYRRPIRNTHWHTERGGQPPSRAA
jgi:hypothetical protein